MPRNAVTSLATGRVVKWGDLDFLAAGEVGAGTQQVPVNDEAIPPAGVPLQNVKVVGLDFQPMTAPEAAAADAEVAQIEEAETRGAAIVQRTVNDSTELPLPPPGQGRLVGMADGGAGVAALAISGNARWFIFDSDRIVGP